MADACVQLSRDNPIFRRPRLSRSAARALLHEANPELFSTLAASVSLEDARDEVYDYLSRRDRWTYDLDCDIHALEKVTVRECTQVLRSIIGPVHEALTKVSALECLRLLVSDSEADPEVSPAFLMEMISLFRGIAGKSGIYQDDEPLAADEVPEFLQLEGRRAALERTEVLDELARDVTRYFRRYPSGLEPEVIARREKNRRRILSAFGASEEEWRDYRWHLEHVITTGEVLFDLIELDEPHQDAVSRAIENGIPLGITPYYLSLMDFEVSSSLDHAVRAQVLPPPDYVDSLTSHMSEREDHFDFMGERDTSPVRLVTRRYPQICILKPYNTCSQICVYCQRNWEIDQCMDPDAMAPDELIERAIDWIEAHQEIGEVLITGGDPAVMDDSQIEPILEALGQLDQIYRIRIGTRTPVVLPYRWTDSLADLLARYHEPGRREVLVVTHFEHSYEITPEAMDAVQQIRTRGMCVYNQEVFTLENSRRFESAKLRRDLRLIGVDPYYTFNAKGKKETAAYRVPIARLLQERKEEARLLPGADRTDEPVFNVPRLGKHHLRATQDRALIMIRPENGARVYEFQPWEKNITAVPSYHYDDVPILDYLERLTSRGEDIEDYRTIWYYF